MPESSAYSDTVLDHFQHPRNVGELEGANAVGRAENSACGDVLELYLRVEGRTIAAASFRSFGCVAAIAAGSRLTEMLTGCTVDAARLLRRDDVARALGGLPRHKLHCSVLAEDAIADALSDSCDDHR